MFNNDTSMKSNGNLKTNWAANETMKLERIIHDLSSNQDDRYQLERTAAKTNKRIKVPPVTVLDQSVEVDTIHRTRYATMQHDEHNSSKENILVLDDCESSHETINNMDSLLKIVAISWLVIAISTLIISIVGHLKSDQTTGYMCLSCPSKYYFEASSCIAQSLYNGSCRGTPYCRTDLLLTCQSGVCKCDSTSNQQWNGVKCSQMSLNSLFSYNRETCSNTTQCKSGLVCRTSGTSCNCPSSVPLNKCDCPVGAVGSEYYSDGTTCLAALSYGLPCSASYMCQTVSQNTVCSAGVCKCSALEYFNTVTNKCIPQLLESEACSLTTDCRTDKGLSCQSGLCKCDSTIQYWSGTTCVNLANLTYNEACVNNAQCAGSLICRTTGTSCNCPLNVALNKCDCPDRVIGNELYWDGSSCVPASSYGKACTTLQDYNCKTLEELTSCISGQCDCAPPSVFNSIQCLNSQCVAGWTLYNGICYKFSTNSVTIATAPYDPTGGTVTTVCGRPDSRLAVLYNDVGAFFRTKLSNDYLIDAYRIGSTSIFQSKYGSYNYTGVNDNGDNCVKAKRNGGSFELESERCQDREAMCQYTP